MDAERDDRPGLGLLLTVVVVLAILVEALVGMASAAEAPGWAHVVLPPAWPDPLRGLWWLVIGAAAGRGQWLLRAGRRGRLVVALATTAPFVAFAVGSALGSPLTSWH